MDEELNGQSRQPQQVAEQQPTKEPREARQASEQQQPIDQTDDQLMDVLLVLDKEEKKIRAVKGIDEKGELQTVPATKEHNNDFLKLDKHGDILSNFLSNFMSQVKDPTRFRFFKVPAKVAEKVAAIFQSNTTHPTPAGDELMIKQEVDASQYKKQETQTQQPVQPQQKPSSALETVPPVQVSPTQAQQSVSTQQPAQQDAGSETKKYRYDPAKIDWETAKQLGITKEKLEKGNVLDTMLKGFKSPGLYSVGLNFGTVISNHDARLSFREKPDGTLFLVIHGIKGEPGLKQPFMGHTFTDEDKANLTQSGNMGRIVNVVHPKTGEIIPSVISIDKLTNELVSLPANKIKIPNEIKGVVLTEVQKMDLQQGKSVYLTGMTSKAGKPFDAPVQFNAEKRFVEFLFLKQEKGPEQQQRQQHFQKQSDQPKELPDSFRQRPITDEQRKELLQGGTIYMDGFMNKNDKPYQGYITWNPETSAFNFKFPHQYHEAVDKGEILPIKKTSADETPAQSYQRKNNKGQKTEAELKNDKNPKEAKNQRQDLPKARKPKTLKPKI